MDKDLHALGEHLATDGFQHHVHSSPVGDGHGFCKEVGLVVVDAVVGPQLTGPVQLLLGACGGDDGAAHVLGNLDARHAHATASRLYQGRLALTQVGDLEKGEP